MALYLIERGQCSYDEYESHVINAANEAEVRREAARGPGDEGEGPWLDEQRSTVTLIGTSLNGDDAVRTILSSFHAG